MASLANQTISSTYDGLIKTSSDNAVGVSGVQLLQDGSGNDLALSVGRSGNGVTITGSLNATLATAAQPNITSVGTLSSLAVSGDLTIGDKIVHDGDTNTAIRFPAADTVTIETAGTERMRIDSSGNLLINRQSANATYLPKLEISGTAADGTEGVLIGSYLPTLTFQDFSGGSTVGQIQQDGTGLVFKNNNAEAMRIDSSGNVGIGTQTADIFGRFYTRSVGIDSLGITKIQIDGATYTGIDFGVNGTRNGEINNTSTGFGINTIDARPITLTTNSTERMRIDSSGVVKIGGTDTGYSPTKLHTGSYSSTEAGINILNSTTGIGYILFGDGDGGASYVGQISYKHGDNYMAFQTADTERMRITSGGDVFIGTTNPTLTDNGIGLYDTGQIYTQIDGTNATSQFIFYRNGSIVGSIQTDGTSTSYNTSSDYRLKENVVPMEGALDRVDALKPSRFNFIADTDNTVDGFLAHEVAEVVPEAISGEKDAVEEYEVTPAVLDDEGNVIEEAVMGTRPVYQGIDQSKLVPLLVGAIQELRAEIELLKNK